MKTMRAMMVVLAALAFLGVGNARAQITASARLSAGRAYVGDTVQLIVEVGGSKEAERPEAPEVPGLRVTFQGGQDTSRRSVMIINGRRTEDSFEGYVYSFLVVPTRAGRFTIPPITVRVNGKEYTTQAVALTAVEPGDVAGFRLLLEAEKTSVYVGEPVRVRITWLMGDDAQGGTFSMADSDAFELLPAPTEARGSEFMLFGKPAVAVQGRGELDGQACDTITVERVFVARRAGKVTMGPIRLAFDQVVTRGFFGQSERRVISSNALEFDVKELPSPKPANFNGLVGKYRVETTATPTDVHVGDPISLNIYVLGPDPLEAVPPMTLGDQPGFAGAFKAPDEPSIPAVQQTNQGRAAVFTQTIRVQRESVKEIPAIVLPYFDVEKGEYGEARSRPIALKVSPTNEVGLPADMSGSAKKSDGREASIGGLAPLVTSASALAEGGFDLVRALRSPVAMGVAGVPALVYLGSVGVLVLRRRAERDPAGRRRRAALSRARRRLTRAGRRGADAAAIGAAVRGYVADRYDLTEAGLTSAESVARLREERIGSADALAAVLERCDAALYAGAQGAPPTAREAAEVVQRVHTDMEGRS